MDEGSRFLDPLWFALSISLETGWVCPSSIHVSQIGFHCTLFVLFSRQSHIGISFSFWFLFFSFCDGCFIDHDDDDAKPIHPEWTQRKVICSIWIHKIAKPDTADFFCVPRPQHTLTCPLSPFSCLFFSPIMVIQLTMTTLRQSCDSSSTFSALSKVRYYRRIESTKPFFPLLLTHNGCNIDHDGPHTSHWAFPFPLFCLFFSPIMMAPWRGWYRASIQRHSAEGSFYFQLDRKPFVSIIVKAKPGLK